MQQSLTLPSLETIPEDMDDQFRTLLHQAPYLVTEQWLCELIQSSGHLTTSEHLRWRVIALLWLASAFDVDKAWTYLMWFNMGEATVADHLSEIIADGADEMQCHVQLANWMASAQDERLVTFFNTYKNVPSVYKMANLMRPLLAKAQAPEVGVWLAGLCRDTAETSSVLMRRWHLLAATWYATCFNPEAGLAYLQAKSEGQARLATADMAGLSDAAREINATPQVVQWIADCPDKTVKGMLQEFGHPDLTAFVSHIFENPPSYDHLANRASQASRDAEIFKRNRQALEQASIDPKKALILDLGCGPLAPQTVLLTASGYQVTGVDLDIPPDYLPLSIKQRLTKGKYSKAWKAATAEYYKVLGQAAGVKPSWKRAKIELADVTRLELPDHQFEAVICSNHLQHAPDVAGLLSEAARVLKPGGLFIADVVPYASLKGSFTATGQPWGHLRQAIGAMTSGFILNKWREDQFQRALEKQFSLEQWQPVTDDAAVNQLTPEIEAVLSVYSADELTRQEIVIVARKA